MSTGGDVFEAALNAEGVTGQLADVARSIYTQESGGGKNTKTSNAGARGGMQIIPGTFDQVADKGWSIDDPLHNARAGIRYLKQLDKQAGGDPALTAAGYYGGPGGLEKARRGVAVSDPRNPNAPNTLQYGQQVAARLGNKGQTPAPEPSPLPEVAAPGANSNDLVELPPELLAHRVSQPGGGSGAGGPTANAWTQFLAAMPRSKGAAPQPADFSFGMSKPAMNMPNQRRSLKPHFDAFSAWNA